MKHQALRFLPMGLLVVGVLSLFYAATFETAPTGTHNIGLMQVQMMWFGFSSLCIMTAAILFVGATIVAALTERSATSEG